MKCSIKLGLGLALCLFPAFALASSPAESVAERPLAWVAPPYWAPAPAAPGRQALAAERQLVNGGAAALPFFALPGCRLVDTRGNAPLTGGYLAAATIRSYTLTGVCNLPANAQAISLNATVVKPGGPGFLTLWAEGGPFPAVSTLNFLGNDVIANAAVVPLSAGGGISMALGVSGGDVILDTNGYYAPAPGVTSLNALAGDVSLVGGPNVTITPGAGTLSINATGATGATGPQGPAGLAGATGATGPAGAGVAPAGAIILGISGDTTLIGAGFTELGSTSLMAWAPTSTAGAPVGRELHTAVWTGTKMIVWGGGNNLNSGGRYDPASNSWTATSTVGAPEGREFHTTVWTGAKMIVWGGDDGWYGHVFNTGGQYDPATDIWTSTAISGAPTARSRHTAVWTGTRMIVWGGADASFNYFNTGSQYDPANDTWTETSTVAAPSGPTNHTAVWTGAKMIVWGGSVGHPPTNAGGQYDPLADSWTPTSTTGAPAARDFHTAVWTGTKMIVWGGVDKDGHDIAGPGGQYDPASDTWTPTSMVGAPAPRYGHSAVWTGAKMIVWGAVSSGDQNTGGIYDSASDSWMPTPTAGAPLGRYFHSAVWTGSRMIVWGGGAGNPLNSGGQYVCLSLYVKN